MNAIPFLFPAGYVTGQFRLAQQVLAEDSRPDRLLDLLLLADQLDNQAESHTQPPPGDWEGLRDAAGAKLMRSLGAKCDNGWKDRDTNWEPKMFRLALKSIPTMAGSDLLTLYIQSSETSYLHEAEPMQARWEKVANQCRAEILRRIAAAPHGGGLVAVEFEARQGEDTLSLRDILRIVEEAFDPDMPDDRLLDLYLVVDSHGGPDEEVFDEILEQVTELFFSRLRQGSPHIDPDTHTVGFDPHEDKAALTALLEGELSHRDLVVLYLVSFDNEDLGDRADRWSAVNDLARAQILGRMSPNDRERRHPTDLIWRFADEAAGVSNRGGDDEAED